MLRYYGRVFLCLALCICFVHGLDLSWTQYSDRASLPYSTRARDDLRASLDRISTEHLSGSEKMRLRQLKRVLDKAKVESLHSESIAGFNGILRLRSPELLRTMFCAKGLISLIAVLVLSCVILGISGPVHAFVSAQVAARKALDILDTEQRQSQQNQFSAHTPCVSEFFPSDVAEVLCSRIRSVVSKDNAKKRSADVKPMVTAMSTQDIAAKITKYYPPPPVDCIDKALRREKKKNRQAAAAAEKALEDAKCALRKAVDHLTCLTTKHHAYMAKIGAKTPSTQKKGTVDDIVASLANAKTDVTAKEHAVGGAEHALCDGQHSAERPRLVYVVEAAWLHAVTQSWSQRAIQSNMSLVSSHIHVWARDIVLRESAERIYNACVERPDFLS